MKKLLIVLICALSIMLSACDDKSASDAVNTTVEEETTATNYVIDEISGIEGYSYIGAGAVTETESNTRSVHSHYEKKILGIRKSDGKAEPVKFKNTDGKDILVSPAVTAELVTDGFAFYKLSYSSTDYHDADFKSADGDMYCFSLDNGYIYKLDGVKSMYTDLGNYDYYDGLFVGSFIFEDGTEYLCKVYVEGSEIKIDKKINVIDIPDFKKVFLDRNKNIFAWEYPYPHFTIEQKENTNLSYTYILKYILSNKGKIYARGNDWIMLGFNRVVYGTGTAQYRDDGNNNNIITDYSYVHTLKEILSSSKYSDLDLAYTTDFCPTELDYYSWTCCMHGPYHNWYYSELLGVIDGRYVYLTRATNYYGLIFVKFLDDNHMEYRLEFCLNKSPGGGADSVWGDEITHQWIYSDGKIYYFRGDSLHVVDIKNETNTVFSNDDIVKYHSLEKVNNNKVGFLGTNSYAEKVYYEINTADDSITLIGVTPTYSSVSFKPINQ